MQKSDKKCGMASYPRDPNGSGQNGLQNDKSDDQESGCERPYGGGLADLHEMPCDEPGLRRGHEKKRRQRKVAFSESEAHQGEPEEQDPDECVGAVQSR